VKQTRILGCDFDAVTLDETLDRIMSLIHERRRGYLCTVNCAILMMMRGNTRLRGFVDKAFMIVADGMPLVWGSRLRGEPLPERVTGVDLVEGLCERAAKQRLGIYLLGAAPGVAQRVADRYTKQFPGLIVSGISDGYFSAADCESKVREINESRAAILIVAMGVPRQEAFIEDNWSRLEVPFAIPVGGSFDVLAGDRARAPRLIQAMGLEWAFRLAQEPRRLFRRYLTTNTQFFYFFMKELLLGR
jgi:N-acetylglucosaminyldiphosphoundecaprenol N-acetyl-beta-D-mannosaminyltransferase